MKMTALEVIFWFPLKSFSSLKCILLSVLSAFLLCFKANHKGCVASVEIFFFFFEKKLFHVMQKRAISSQPQAWEASEPAFNWRNFFRIIMGLADYSFLSFFPHHGLNLCFPWDVVFQILFLFCTCCFRLVKCSWIMLVYFHNFVLWEESCRETFSQNGADMCGRWGQTDGVRRIFVLWGRIIRAVFSQISTASQAPLRKGAICMFLSSNFSDVILKVQRKGYEFLLYLLLF